MLLKYTFQRQLREDVQRHWKIWFRNDVACFFLLLYVSRSQIQSVIWFYCCFYNNELWAKFTNHNQHGIGMMNVTYLKKILSYFRTWHKHYVVFVERIFEQEVLVFAGGKVWVMFSLYKMMIILSIDIISKVSWVITE